MSSDVKSMHLGKITSFFIPTVTLVGEHSAAQIPDRLRIIGGKKPLVVTDEGIVAVGILKQVTDILDASGMVYAIYDKTVRFAPKAGIEGRKCRIISDNILGLYQKVWFCLGMMQIRHRRETDGQRNECQKRACIFNRRPVIFSLAPCGSGG